MADASAATFRSAGPGQPETVSPIGAGTLAELVRRLRERALLTQEELAVRSGLSSGTVRRLETGRTRNPRGDSVRMLADGLGLVGPERAALLALARAPVSARTRRSPDRSVARIPPEPGTRTGGGPDDPDDAGPAERTAPDAVVPAQLPMAVAGFSGRAEAIRLLDAALSDTGTAPVILTITGTAGVGKTALAVHWAHRVRDRFPDGQLYVNLRGFDPAGSPTRPEEVVRDFLDALRVPPQCVPTGLAAQAARYRSLLAGRRMLIVLDNARDVEQVRPLLPGVPGCLVLITSRHRLTGLVAVEGARPVRLDLLSAAEARDLLARRLGAERVAGEPAAIEAIVHRCARLPLALAIVAAHAVVRPELSLATLADELREVRDRLDVLDGEDPTTDLRAVFSWSYRALRPAAAGLFRLLGLHPGPDLGRPAAAALAGLPPAKLRSALAELTRAHLVTEPEPGRYALHDLLRAYAGELTEREDAEPDRRAALRRMLDHYLHTAHAAALLLMPNRAPVLRSAPAAAAPVPLPDERAAAGWFAAEERVLLAAVEWSEATGFDTHAWQLAWALQDFLDRRGHWAELAAVQRAALRAARRTGDVAGQAQAHRGFARALFRQGRYAEAHAELRQALDRYAELGDQAGAADTTRNLGLVLWQLGRPREALDHARRALALYPERGHPAGRARALNDLGWCHALLGEYRRSVRYCRQALRLQREIGDRRGEAATWHSLGQAQRHLGQLGSAIECHRRALALFVELDDRYYQAEVLTGLGEVYRCAGDPDAARAAWRRALEILTLLRHAEADQVRARLATLRPVAVEANHRPERTVDDPEGFSAPR